MQADELRTKLQNDKMWPMLRDIARVVPIPVMCDGQLQVRKVDEWAWKDILTAGLEKQQMMAQGIDGGWVLLGKKTTKFSLAKMRDLLELIKFYGESKGVKWSDPKSAAFDEYWSKDGRIAHN